MTKNRPSTKPLAVFLAAAVFWTLNFVDVASAQRRKPDNLGTIDAGTTIAVRTDETIDADTADGSVFSGTVDKDVINRNGRVAIPEGADVDLVVRQISNNQLALDIDGITFNNQRYGIQTESSVTTDTRKEGIGANKRTGKYVGGGALLGAIIGGIAGGGKGAAIGAGVGAAGGAGAQVLTRGRSVSVPAETLLTFKLQQPMQVGASTSRFSTQQGVVNQSSPAVNGSSIRVRGDNQVTWQAPEKSTVYVIVDNNPRKLFASGMSGTQDASWMTGGHRYTFVLIDPDGYEIGRDVMDLRR
jgi:hypothetical protein